MTPATSLTHTLQLLYNYVANPIFSRRSTIVYERQERADALAAEEEHASFTEEFFGSLQARALVAVAAHQDANKAEAEDEVGEPARSSFTRKASVFGGFQQSHETSNSSDYGFSSGSESDDDEFDGFGFDFDTSNTCNTKTPMVHGVVVKTLMVLVAVDPSLSSAFCEMLLAIRISCHCLAAAPLPFEPPNSFA